MKHNICNHFSKTSVFRNRWGRAWGPQMRWRNQRDWRDRPTHHWFLVFPWDSFDNNRKYEIILPSCEDVAWRGFHAGLSHPQLWWSERTWSIIISHPSYLINNGPNVVCKTTKSVTLHCCCMHVEQIYILYWYMMWYIRLCVCLCVFTVCSGSQWETESVWFPWLITTHYSGTCRRARHRPK